MSLLNTKGHVIITKPRLNVSLNFAEKIYVFPKQLNKIVNVGCTGRFYVRRECKDQMFAMSQVTEKTLGVNKKVRILLILTTYMLRWIGVGRGVF